MSEGGEKTFAPTHKRRQDAARKGDVLRSRELATAAAMLVGAAWLKWMAPALFSALVGITRAGLTWDRALLEDFSPARLILPLAWAVIVPVVTLAMVVAVATVASQLAFGEGRFNAGNALPKGSRLDPLSGLRRMFGATGWIEMAKGLAKVGLLGVISWGWARTHFEGLSTAAHADLLPQLVLAWGAITSLLFALAAGLVVIAGIDLPVQLVRRLARLRMSHQDMRDEHKESEGSPERKAAQRQRQRQIAMGGIQSAMREAQFVLTNPRRFAVALAYDPGKASAPVVMAKGRGEKAMAIRELAADLDLPTLEYPALARSLYFTTRERQVIREELYAAVAAVLAFVFSLKRGERPPLPSVVVPLALRFDADGRLDPASAT